MSTLKASYPLTAKGSLTVPNKVDNASPEKGSSTPVTKTSVSSSTEESAAVPSDVSSKRTPSSNGHDKPSLISRFKRYVFASI